MPNSLTYLADPPPLRSAFLNGELYRRQRGVCQLSWWVGGGIPHTHQVKRNSKRFTSLSNSKVPGLERLFRRQVFASAWHTLASTRSNSVRQARLAARRPAKARTAWHALVKLFVGSPHTLAMTSQCCTSAASSRDQTRTICRTTVEPFSTATRSCDFQRLNSNSTCQRARYKTAASFGVSISTGTLVTKMVQSHHAKRSALGSRPFLLIVS